MNAEKVLSARNTGPQQRTLLAVAVTASLLFSACASSTSLATISGESGATDPGAVAFESSCASCHGSRGEGGTGPPLAGHTAEQIIRQVRAPVGEMPIFAPGKVTPQALDSLVEMITNLHAGDVGHDASGGGHGNETGRLSGREVSQLQHGLVLLLLEDADRVAIAHAIEEATAMLSGSHAAAMSEVLAEVEAGLTSGVEQMMLDMATRIPDGLDVDGLLLSLALNELRGGDTAAARHWVDHVEGVEANLIDAFESGSLTDANELIEALLPGQDHEAEDEDADGDDHEDADGDDHEDADGDDHEDG